MASELQDDFDNIGWIICMQSNQIHDESIFVTKVNVIINENYKPLSKALQSQCLSNNPKNDYPHINDVGPWQIQLNIPKIHHKKRKSSIEMQRINITNLLFCKSSDNFFVFISD